MSSLQHSRAARGDDLVIPDDDRVARWARGEVANLLDQLDRASASGAQGDRLRRMAGGLRALLKHWRLATLCQEITR